MCESWRDFAYRALHLVHSHAIRPELAAMLAAPAFAGMSKVINSPANPVRSWANFRHDEKGGWIGMLVGGRDPADQVPDRSLQIFTG